MQSVSNWKWSFAYHRQGSRHHNIHRERERDAAVACSRIDCVSRNASLMKCIQFVFFFSLPEACQIIFDARHGKWQGMEASPAVGNKMYNIHIFMLCTQNHIEWRALVRISTQRPLHPIAAEWAEGLVSVTVFFFFFLVVRSSSFWHAFKFMPILCGAERRRSTWREHMPYCINREMRSWQFLISGDAWNDWENEVEMLANFVVQEKIVRNDGKFVLHCT